MKDDLSADTSQAFRSTSVRADILLDRGPGEFRIGLIVLSNDYATERDFINMRPGDQVAIFSTRIPNCVECTPENLARMAPNITSCTQLLVPEGRLDVVAYACTSGTVVIGYDAVRERIQTARPGVPCVTPITASLAAFEKFGARRLAVLTPYVDEVNSAVDAHLAEQRKEVVGFSSFGIEDNEEMSALTPEAIFQAALKADRRDADALFISCTAIRAVDVVERIEQALGKPVVTANQAMVWQSLRTAGCDTKVPGFGSLLRMH